MNAPSYCTFVPLYQQDVNLAITSVLHMLQVDNIPHVYLFFSHVKTRILLSHD